MSTSPYKVITPWLLSGLALMLFAGCGNSANSEQANLQQPKTVVVNKPINPEPAPEAGEAEWTRWRGPERDGISREQNYKREWNMEPPVVWRHNIGIGYSSVSVADNRLYAMGHPEGTEQETVWCLNAETGKQVWSISYDCALLDHLHKGGPGATPTVDGDVLYVNSREGEIRKLNAENGELIWLFDIRKELKISLPEWGFTGSAIIRGNEVIFEAGSVFAIDKESGKLAWQTTPHMPGYGTPELFEWKGTPYLAALSNEGLAIINLNSHQEVAFAEWESPYDTNSSTPIWHEGQIFVSTGYNIGCGLFDFDGESLSLVWKNKEMRNHMNSCILQDGFLYGFDGNSHVRRTVTVKCLDWKTGEVQWVEKGLGCGALAATQSDLLIMSDDGELLIAELTPEAFYENGRVRVMKEQCWTVPVLCNGLVYCRGAEGSLACVSLRPEDQS